MTKKRAPILKRIPWKPRKKFQLLPQKENKKSRSVTVKEKGKMFKLQEISFSYTKLPIAVRPKNPKKFSFSLLRGKTSILMHENQLKRRRRERKKEPTARNEKNNSNHIS